jgi:hypothetical protein
MWIIEMEVARGFNIKFLYWNEAFDYLLKGFLEFNFDLMHTESFQLGLCVIVLEKFLI